MTLQLDEHIPNKNAETKRLMYSVVLAISYCHILQNHQSQRHSLCTVMSQVVQICMLNKVQDLEKKESWKLYRRTCIVILSDLFDAVNKYLAFFYSFTLPSQAYYNRGLTKMKLKHAKSIHDFNRALAINPKLFQAFLSRAAYYGTKGRFSKGIMNCNEAIKLQPRSVRAYLYR